MEKEDEKERNNFMRIFKGYLKNDNRQSFDFGEKGFIILLQIFIKNKLIAIFYKDKTIKRPTSAKSNAFQSTRTLKRPSSSLPNHNDTSLIMTNDLKYVGNQFVVGKVNPNLQSTHEIRFQKLYSARLKKLHINKSKEQRPLTMSELKEMHNALAIAKRTT